MHTDYVYVDHLTLYMVLDCKNYVIIILYESQFWFRDIQYKYVNINYNFLLLHMEQL